MKVLITGKNGYIARCLANDPLFSKHDIVAIGRETFDLTDKHLTREWFKDKYFDIVIHTAIQGGSRLYTDSSTVLSNNLLLYENLLASRSHFNKLINFGSGAEIFFPNTFYGRSKNLIAQSVMQNINFFNIRIFAVFDENELNTRFIKSCLISYIDRNSIVINKNKKMDFFYSKDLVKVVDFFINEKNPPKEYDCCYDESLKLSDIAGKINQLNSYRVAIKCSQDRETPQYCGVYKNLGLKLYGLKKGITETYLQIRNHSR